MKVISGKYNKQQGEWPILEDEYRDNHEQIREAE